MAHFLEFVANDRVAFGYLTNVTAEGLCHDAKVAFDFFKLVWRHYLSLAVG